jgi:hypothetical protein
VECTSTLDDLYWVSLGISPDGAAHLTYTVGAPEERFFYFIRDDDGRSLRLETSGAGGSVVAGGTTHLVTGSYDAALPLTHVLVDLHREKTETIDDVGCVSGPRSVAIDPSGRLHVAYISRDYVVHCACTRRR